MNGSRSKATLRTWTISNVNRRRLGHAALATWFAFNLWHQSPPWGDLGDALLYHDASAAWLNGMDPWAVATPSGFHYSAPPPTLLVFAPFGWIDGHVFAIGFGLVSVMAAYVLVRELRLPIYWLLFPPLVEAVNAGNPHVLALALLLSRGRAIAPVLKLYALVPMLGERRWSSIAALGSVTILTIVVWPGLWASYLAQFAAISSRLVQESAGGFAVTGLLAIPVGIALLTLGPRTASWWAVPALWPGSQYFYASMAMPVLASWAAIPLAIRAPGIAGATVVATSLLKVGVTLRDRRRGLPTTPWHDS